MTVEYQSPAVLDKIILETFNEFLAICKTKYLIGDRKHYPLEGFKFEYQHCVNTYLSSEDDIKVKFGGLLEQKLIAIGLPFTVHSELKIYGDPKQRVDLSVHIDTPDSYYRIKEEKKNTLRALIEIKYANFKRPDYDFLSRAIHKDIDKLSPFPDSVKKYFMLIDEADRIPEDNIRDLHNYIKDKSITILTNNSFYHTHFEWINKTS